MSGLAWLGSKNSWEMNSLVCYVLLLAFASEQDSWTSKSYLTVLANKKAKLLLSTFWWFFQQFIGRSSHGKVLGRKWLKVQKSWDTTVPLIHRCKDVSKIGDAPFNKRRKNLTFDVTWSRKLTNQSSVT